MTSLTNFDHIGIVVKDLPKAMEEMTQLLGLECEESMEAGGGDVRIAFYPFGEGKMELLHFQREIEGVDPIVTEPRAGVQHVAFKVENFDNALEELTRKGLKLVKGFPREGAHGKVAFFHPTEGLDLLIEICQ